MDGLGIRKWFLDREITGADVARKAGVSRSLVSKILKGKCSGETIETALRDFGCPEELLKKSDAA
jgi:transcriptional regulator with XRE-family HTH domain